MKLVVAVSGASGAPYAKRLLDFLAAEGSKHGVSVDLVGRAADVMLKERKKLVLVLRETPISLVHARAITQVIEAGAFVMPASPSFYSGPRTIGELVDTVVARVLDRLGLPNELMKRWEGLAPKAPEPVEEP